ncbi:MAG: hypothetical protein M3Q10_09710 [Chloroflexota bacterium]|nr:hypothetical protein [Chloroflexota bacterium]
MTDLATPPTEAPLRRLSDLAARDFAEPAEAIAAVLELAREMLGVGTALITQTTGGTWRAVHVADAAFGLVPGSTLPLRDTF